MSVSCAPLFLTYTKVQFGRGCLEATFLVTTEGSCRRYVQWLYSPYNKERVEFKMVRISMVGAKFGIKYPLGLLE